MATIFRAPLIAPMAQQLPRVPSFDPPNILLATLIATIPFSNIEWPAPRPIPYVHREFDPPTIQAPAAFPFSEPQWPSLMPSAPKVAAFDPPNLVLSTLVPTRPFFEPQWASSYPPLPKVAAFDPPNNLLASLVVTTPFFPVNWVNPPFPLPKVLDFDSPFAGVPPPAPPIEVLPTGGHWLKPTPKQIARWHKLGAEARKRAEDAWTQSIREHNELREQIMSQLKPEVLGIKIVDTWDDEDDIETLLTVI